MRKLSFYLSLVLVFTMPWENLFDVEALGTVARVVGLVLGAVWFFAAVIRGRVRRPKIFHVAVLAFFLWNAGTLLWTIDLDKTLVSVCTYLQLFGLVVVLWDLYNTPEELRAAMQAYVLGAYVSVASVVAAYLADSVAARVRYSATGFDENDLGMILALGMPAAWYLAGFRSKGRLGAALSLINYFYVPAATAGIVLSGSRAAFLALLPALVLIGASVRRLKARFQILTCGGLIAVLLLAAPLVPQASLDRLATTGTEMTAGDINGRMWIWREGLASFAERPMAGFGAGAFRTAIPSHKYAHNFVVLFLVEDGLVGLALFCTILALAVHHARGQPKWDSRLWLTILLIWLIGAASHNWEQRKQTWLFLSLIPIGASFTSPSRRPCLGAPGLRKE